MPMVCNPFALIDEIHANVYLMCCRTGNTALHWAAYRNQPKLVEYLLRAGANPEMANSPDGQTPLHWACVSGNIICASLIITVGT
jgi:ankyrin repeat protein